MRAVAAVIGGGVVVRLVRARARQAHVTCASRRRCRRRRDNGAPQREGRGSFARDRAALARETMDDSASSFYTGSLLAARDDGRLRGAAARSEPAGRKRTALRRSSVFWHRLWPTETSCGAARTKPGGRQLAIVAVRRRDAVMVPSERAGEARRACVFSGELDCDVRMQSWNRAGGRGGIPFFCDRRTTADGVAWMDGKRGVRIADAVVCCGVRIRRSGDRTVSAFGPRLV